MSTTTAYDWREDMRKAGSLKDRAAGANKQASERLWKACKAGIEEWLPNASTDVAGEGLYGEFLDAYGESRKGDCSKMKTVALAVKNHGLVPTLYDNLSKAYAEARRLTQTVQQERQEDEAIEDAIQNLAASAPKTATTPESAAQILLAKGVDECARLLLDALGATNTDAHRALVRALSQEVAGRIKPAATPKAASGPKEGAIEATGGVTAKPKAAAIKTAGTKAKATGKATTAKATPVSKSKGDPNNKALPPKASADTETSADKGEPVSAPVPAGEPSEQAEGASTAPVAKRTGARPIIKRPAAAKAS